MLSWDWEANTHTYIQASTTTTTTTLLPQSLIKLEQTDLSKSLYLWTGHFSTISLSHSLTFSTLMFLLGCSMILSPHHFLACHKSLGFKFKCQVRKVFRVNIKGLILHFYPLMQASQSTYQLTLSEFCLRQGWYLYI